MIKLQYIKLKYLHSLSNIVTFAALGYLEITRSGNEVSSITTLKVSSASNALSSVMLIQNITLVSPFANVTLHSSES